MAASASIQESISAHYGDLSAKLQDAADFVVANPVDVATRSLRSVAASSGVSPATFSRLARALGYDSYEEMRELSRNAVGRKVVSFSEKARILQTGPAAPKGGDLLHRQSAACVMNIEAQAHDIDQARLEDAVDRLSRARRVLLVGALGSSGIVDYFAYLASWFTDNWSVAGRNGIALSSSLSRTGPEDVVIILSKTPFAKRSINTAEIAAGRGATVIVLTDSHTCPALRHASHGFILPTESPQFFSSYAATLVLIETIISMLVARAGPEAEARIAEVEAQNHRLEEFWAP